MAPCQLIEMLLVESYWSTAIDRKSLLVEKTNWSKNQIFTTKIKIEFTWNQCSGFSSGVSKIPESEFLCLKNTGIRVPVYQKYRNQSSGVSKIPESEFLCLKNTGIRVPVSQKYRNQSSCV